jgi:hypothetical protein
MLFAVRPAGRGVAGGYNLYAYLAKPLTGVDILGLHPDGPERSHSQGEGATRPTINRILRNIVSFARRAWTKQNTVGNSLSHKIASR